VKVLHAGSIGIGKNRPEGGSLHIQERKETHMDNRKELLDDIFETALQNDMTYFG